RLERADVSSGCHVGASLTHACGTFSAVTDGGPIRGHFGERKSLYVPIRTGEPAPRRWSAGMCRGTDTWERAGAGTNSPNSLEWHEQFVGDLFRHQIRTRESFAG